MLCLIYILRNTVNSKVYIGQTWRSLKERFRRYDKRQSHLFNAINLYGKDRFYYEVVTVAHTQEIADYWEIYFINKYNSTNTDFGFNLKTGGARGRYVHRIGEAREHWINKLMNLAKNQYENNVVTREILQKNQFKPGHVPFSKGKPMPDVQYNEWLPYAIKPEQHNSIKTEFKSGNHYSIDTKFKTGVEPYNKGKKMPKAQKDKCAPTMFKVGQTPHNKKQFTPEEIKNILTKYEQGQSILTIAKEYGCSYSPIRRIIDDKSKS